MATTAGAVFDKVFNWDGVGTSGSDYADVTLESQSPAGTSFTILNSTAHHLYLGHSSKFDLAIVNLGCLISGCAGSRDNGTRVPRTPSLFFSCASCTDAVATNALIRATDSVGSWTRSPTTSIFRTPRY